MAQNSSDEVSPRAGERERLINLCVAVHEWSKESTKFLTGLLNEANQKNAPISNKKGQRNSIEQQNKMLRDRVDTVLNKLFKEKKE
jgi:hypothetical protein